MNISPISAESEHGPLCRSYVCAAFDPLRFQVESDAGVRDSLLVWAVGVLSDQRPHFLGSWYRQDPKDAWWRGIATDLHDRGVERLRIVIGADPVETQAAMTPFYSHTTVLPALAALEHSEVESILCGHRAYVERTLDVAHALSLRLKRAVARNGVFADAEVAAALLHRTADRYIYREWPEQSESARAFHSRGFMALPAAVD